MYRVMYGPVKWRSVSFKRFGIRRNDNYYTISHRTTTIICRLINIGRCARGIYSDSSFIGVVVTIPTANKPTGNFLLFFISVLRT